MKIKSTIEEINKAFDEKFPIRHYYCEDGWYSCPLAPEGCFDDSVPQNKCNCGAIEEQEVIKSFYTQQILSLIEELEGKLPKKKDILLEEPILFQSNPAPNEMGGYSSVPFYCSLCGMGEMDIQDNKLGVLEDDDKYYACHCSVWSSPTGGKWIKWFDKEKAIKILNDLPSEDRSFNQAIDQMRASIKEFFEIKD